MVKLGSQKGLVTLPNCLFCPNIHMNLISPKSLVGQDHDLKLNQDGLHHSDLNQAGTFPKTDVGLIKYILSTVNLSAYNSKTTNLLQVKLSVQYLVTPISERRFTLTTFIQFWNTRHQ
ncbi:Polyprotein [Candida maltosa Xu316]|uniref:Polyprotein n=1 Tax=Candida maltosa (strain Xu316) TaxID=1245528 RepID=M3JF99_CANMX|nr:Polyprotein [Candida maltosa Xu316]